jgi:DNA polymerase (family 10)
LETPDNDHIAEVLRLTGRLMDLHGENSFKANAYTNTAFRIDKFPEPISEWVRKGIHGQIEGIGPGMRSTIKEIVETGTHQQLENLLKQTPPGVLEMMQIKGIGPKKVAVIWKMLEITTPGELLYACIENRLSELKGFGLKTQASIQKAIEYKISNQGKLLYARARALMDPIVEWLRKESGCRVEYSGEMRRACSTINEALLLVKSSEPEKIGKLLSASTLLLQVKKISDSFFTAETPDGFKLSVQLESENFTGVWLQTTATPEHLLEARLNTSIFFKEESEYYQVNNLSYFPPELREGKGEVARYKNTGIPDLIQVSDIRGILHAHSTWSDGSHTLEKMAKAAKAQGYAYLGITDHSKAAFYANGLSEGRIEEQHKEIDRLNIELAPFKIFKGIEADILNDGSLDYDDSVLATFDFIVASVHSNLRMSEEKAMMRLIRAVENPRTTILGHPSGRLLLAREAYPVDWKKLIDACVANGVVIELNANPYRLDIDWEWIPYALEKGAMISINPDAHSVEGYEDIVWGVAAARKGGLVKEKNLSSMGVDEIQNVFQ